jgi:hypothetical protein
MSCSQWPLGLRHELFSSAKTQGRGLQPRSKYGYLCAFINFSVVLCVGGGLVTR